MHMNKNENKNKENRANHRIIIVFMFYGIKCGSSPNNMHFETLTSDCVWSWVSKQVIRLNEVIRVGLSNDLVL